MFKPIREKMSKLPKWLKWGIPITAIAVLSAGAYYLFSLKSKTESISTAPDIQYATAQTGSIIISASGSGTLITKDDANLKFGTSGEITTLNLKVGDVIEKGQELAALDPTDSQYAYATAFNSYMSMISASAIASAQQSLENAKDDLASAKSSLEYLISPLVFRWEGIVETDEDTLADLKAEAISNPSEEASAAITAAEARLSESQKSLQFAWNTWKYDYVPENFTEKETDQRSGIETIVYYTDTNGNTWPVINTPTEDDIALARATYNLAKATVEEDEIYLNAIVSGEIPYDATGSKIASLRSARKAMENAQEVLESVVLTAPISGTVMTVDAKVGDEVNSGNAVLTISDLSQPYYIEVYFDESDWGIVKTGNEAEVVFDILPDESYRGVVTEVTPSLVSGGGSKLVHCYVLLTETVEQDLPSGTAAAVDVIGARAENVVLVPVEAIREIADGQFGVFMVVNGELELRIVEVGISNDIKIEVKSGISAGDTLSTGIMETVQ